MAVRGGRNVELDLQKWQEALRKYQAASKRTVAQNLKDQARLLIVDVAQRTPPGDFSGGKWKKTAGEKLIKADLNKIMVDSKRVNARTDPRRIHLQFRRKRGRVRTDLRKGSDGGKDRRWRVQGLKTYAEQVKKRVGYMASGWAQAAALVAAKLPAWITRHAAPGYGKVNVRGNDIELLMGNVAVYSEIQGMVERRVQASLRKRYWQMIKRVDFAAKQAAQESGFTVGGS